MTNSKLQFSKLIAGWLFLILCISVSRTSQAAVKDTKQDIDLIKAHLAENVRRSLILLPFYGVFDNLAFEIKDIDTVILSGQVTQPSVKSDAEKAVRQLEGAGKVENNIEVLPLSPNDDRIRKAVYRAIYSTAGLDRYSWRAIPPIHIIVKNGNVTLMGVVATQADKDLAGLKATQVSGVFKLTNDLRVEKEGS